MTYASDIHRMAFLLPKKPSEEDKAELRAALPYIHAALEGKDVKHMELAADAEAAKYETV